MATRHSLCSWTPTHSCSRPQGTSGTTCSTRCEASVGLVIARKGWVQWLEDSVGWCMGGVKYLSDGVNAEDTTVPVSLIFSLLPFRSPLCCPRPLLLPAGCVPGSPPHRPPSLRPAVQRGLAGQRSAAPSLRLAAGQVRGTGRGKEKDRAIAEGQGGSRVGKWEGWVVEAKGRTCGDPKCVSRGGRVVNAICIGTGREA